MNSALTRKQAPVEVPSTRGVPSSDAPSTHFRYPDDVIRRALEHFEHLEALSQQTHFLRHRDDLTTRPEDLMCLYLDLKQAVPLLPLRQRKAVVLHLVEGRTEVESATELGISRNALCKRVMAGLTNLHTLLNDCQHPLRKRGVVVPLRRQQAELPAGTQLEPDSENSLDRGCHSVGSDSL